LVAHELGLSYIHVWDDNIERIYMASIVTDGGTEISEEGVSSETALSHLENLVFADFEDVQPNNNHTGDFEGHENYPTRR